MNKTMKTLGLEHRGLSQLLGLLENQLARLMSDQEVDYTVLDDAIRYIEDHASRHHHPREDVIYRYIVENQLDRDGAFEEVLAEHQTLSHNTQALREALDAILMDSIVPRERLVELLQRFLESERQHLNHEESVIFPLMDSLLAEQDWASIEAVLPSPPDDPLFGQQVKAEYQSLYARLQGSAMPRPERS